MARVERAARDCPPAERGAMLRRWLAALHSLDAEDEAVAARLHEARSPPSEEATAEAKKRVMDAEEEKNIPDAPAAPAAEASSSPPGSPSDPDAEWADVQMPAHGRTVAPAIVAAADDRVSIDVVVDAANVSSASVLRFRSERAKISSFGDKGDDDDESDVFDFRDVLLRSRCLENLVASFADEPAADDDEARLFLKLVDALVWDASSEKSPDETSEPGVDSRISSSLVACVARAGAALRDPKRTAEVQLGDDALVAMLSAGAGSVKKIGAAETLLRRERRLRRALEANAGAVRLLSHEASESSSRGAGAGREKTSVSGAEGSTDSTNAPSPTRSSLEEEIRQTRSADDETSDVKKIVVEKNADDVVRAVTPTSALAAATRLGVDLSRRAHDHAAARALRLAAESELAPTEDALVRCRASLETLAHASTDVAGLSEQSRARLLEAERFRETKLRECVEAETKKRDDAAAAEKRRADAAAALAAAELEASRASEEAERATAERVAFEESAEAVRETLERKVRDLHDRAEEYKAESRAIGVVRDALREIARARARFLEAASAAAADDVASARSRYVEAAKAHGEGQAGAARLCLARLRFCKKELEETRRKRAEASALGIRGGGGDGDSARLGDVVTSTERGSLSADLRAAQRSIERAYVEAEEGAKAVFAAAEASRREATAIAPTAFCSKAESGGSRKGDPPTIDLATVFCAIDDARAAFAAEAATRPVLEIEETRNEDDDDDEKDEDDDDENDSSSTPETHAETPKKRETESRRVSSSPSSNARDGARAEETAATDPPPEPESSSYAPPESEPGSEPVPPAAEDPREDLREPRVASDSDAPPKEKSSARVTTERATEPSVEPTGDDIDDWLSDD